MPSNQWNRVVEIFESANPLPDDERDQWVRAKCGDDQALYDEVRSLLDAARAESQAAAGATPVPSLEGRRYGPWQAERILGTGGMGAVLLVRRADGEFEQTAALKLVAPHLAGPYFLERFRIERQILAHLNHPNITKLLDGGVAEDSGVPYLVMEYVDGLPLDKFADSRKLSIPERLQLFLKVCDAVAFAHRNLVVHRDLKPSNILIETATGEPKLLDFGTARLLPEAGATEATTTFHRMVTPRYASPEALQHAPITTQADVFSLGVLLYEQVAGGWPFGDVVTPADAAQRIISGSITPPDSRINEDVAQSRSTTVRELRGLARGDLAKVLGKATQADLKNRYQSVEEFASDIRAYLAGLPVLAQAPTVFYRSSMFLRRHWAAAAGLTILIAGLGTAAVYSNRQAAIARRQADRAFLSVISLKQMIETASADSPGQDIKLSEVVAASAKSIDLVDPSIRPSMLASLGSVEFSRGNLGSAEKLAQRAIVESRKIGDEQSEADALATLAQILIYSRRSDAERAARSALALARRGDQHLQVTLYTRYRASAVIGTIGVFGAPSPDTGEHFAEALAIGKSYPFLQGDLSSLYAMYAQYLLVRRDRPGELAALLEGLKQFRAKPKATLVDALILDQYRGRLDRDGDFQGAELVARERYEMSRKIAGEGVYSSLDAHLVWALQVGRLGDWEKASKELAACREVYAKLPPSAQVVDSWKLPLYSAMVENRRGNGVGAEAFARIAALAGDQQKWDPGKDPRMAEAYIELGIALRQQARFDEAIPQLSRSQRIYVAAYGVDHRRSKLATRELARAEAHDAGLVR